MDKASLHAKISNLQHLPYRNRTGFCGLLGIIVLVAVLGVWKEIFPSYLLQDTVMSEGKVQVVTV